MFAIVAVAITYSLFVEDANLLILFAITMVVAPILMPLLVMADFSAEAVPLDDAAVDAAVEMSESLDFASPLPTAGAAGLEFLSDDDSTVSSSSSSGIGTMMGSSIGPHVIYYG